jgi:hypothetical protein
MSLQNDSGLPPKPNAYELYVTGEATPERVPGSPTLSMHAQSPFFAPSYHLAPSIEAEPSPSMSDYYMPMHDNVNPNSLMMSNGPPAQPQQQQASRHLSPSTTYLKPSPQLGHQRRASAQDLGMMSPDTFSIPKQRGQNGAGYRVNKKAPRARSRSEQISTRMLKDINDSVGGSDAPPVPQLQRTPQLQQSSHMDMSDAPQVQPMSQQQDGDCEQMPLLKDDTPPEEKLLFELRLRHGNMKGRAMWDAILVDFMEITGKHTEKAALQMKFFRAKAKWVIWTDNYVG